MVKEKKLNHFLKKKGECEGHEIEAVCEVVPILAYFFRWCCLIWRSKKITYHFLASPPPEISSKVRHCFSEYTFLALDWMNLLRTSAMEKLNIIIRFQSGGAS
jgi:hypothetical protein